MFYNTHTLPTTMSQSFRLLYLLEKEKLQKKSLWSWSLMVPLASGSNGLKFSAFETVWIFTLTAIFKPLQSFSKFPFFQICLNFPMSKLQKKLDQYSLLPSGRLELFWLLDRGPLPCRVARGRRQRSFHAQIIPSTQVLFKIMVITMVTMVAIVMNLSDDDYISD